MSRKLSMLVIPFVLVIATSCGSQAIQATKTPVPVDTVTSTPAPTVTQQKTVQPSISDTVKLTPLVPVHMPTVAMATMNMDVTAQISATPTPITCNGALTSRMMHIARGRVSVTGPLLVRQPAGGIQIGSLSNGDTFETVGVPVCLDSILWFHIKNDSNDGWVAEGSNVSYYIEPIK